MSTSSIAAAKRRRAGNVVASPLFKSNNATSNIEPGQRRINRSTENLQNEAVRQLHNPNSVPETQTESVDYKKPMSLQQVITVFDKRLLVLEKAIIDNNIEVPATPTNSVNSVNTELTTNMIETLREDFKITVTEQASEFDYRTQMMAEEITSLKEIVMKLQSYTLDVNKMLMEERMQMFSDTMDHIQIQSDEVLNEDDLAIIDNTQTSTNISMELVHATDNINDDGTIESTTQEELQEAVCEENVEEEYTEEEIAYNKIDEVMFNKKCLNTDMKKNVKLVEEESTKELVETENQENDVEESAEGEGKEEEYTEEEDAVNEESIPEKKSRKKRKDKKSMSVDL
jgi:hypothetical protein